MARNPRYLADFEELAAACADRGVALQTIKAVSRAAWSRATDRFAATWYEPLRDPDAIDLAVGWVLGRPGVFLNTVGDIALLPLVLDAATRATDRPTDDAMARFEADFDVVPLFV